MNLNQVTLPSLDLRAGVAFYERLGLELIVDALPRYVRFRCPDGNSSLSLHLVESLPAGECPIIYFECDHLDEEVMRLQDEGIVFEELPEDKTWLWREARLRDPDNNRIILFFGGKNRLDPPWRVQ